MEKDPIEQLQDPLNMVTLELDQRQLIHMSDNPFTQAALAQLAPFLCADCGHVAHRHVAFVGPCSDCWEECIPICRRFKVKDEDVDRADAILHGAGV